MGKNGGARIGAGRKRGGKNRATIEREKLAAPAIAAAKAGGLLPLDIFLAKMRNEVLPDGTHPSDDQFQAAIAAAPYLHPRLASTDMTMKSDNIHRVVSEKPLTEDAWVAEHGTPANDAVAPESEDGEANAV